MAKKRRKQFRSERQLQDEAVAFLGDVGQMVFGDIHQPRNFHKQLSAAVIALIFVSGWSLYNVLPEADASVRSPLLVCSVEHKNYSVGSATRLVTGQVLECLTSGSNAAPHWHEINRSRLH
ncbi:hypothetical protein ACVBEF_15770 [Glaciimonas sp. GG7]